MGPLVAGTEFEGCRIEETIGRGGMGIVYRARQLELDRDVAIKVITPERVDDPRVRERFVSEARAAAAVEHPNVLPVYGAGVAGGRAYLVMRYVHGDDLRTLVRVGGPLPVERAAAVAVALGDALDAIHRAGYVHRDVKPANVLIDASGHIYLSDFGLARQALATAGLTESGRWVGTLDFAAPEQIRGGPVDARADVYALGGVLHYMLTGAVPFDRDSDEAKLWAHLADPPPLPSALRPELPAALDRVVQRALAKQPQERHPSAGDLGRAARAAAGGAEAEPERTVARGDAAPGGAAALPGLLDGTRTVSAGRPAAAMAGGSPRRRAAIAGGVVGLLAVAAAVVLLGGLGDGRRRAGEAAPAARSPAATVRSPAATAAERGPRVGDTLRGVGFRPRDIAVANGDLWVISARRERIERIGAATLRHHGRQPRIGRGAVSIAAGGRAVWVAMRRRDRVAMVDAASGEVTRRLRVPLRPVLVAAGPSGLWVAGRGADAAPDALLHYDRAGTLVGRADVPEGIKALAVGGGRVWVALDDEWRIVGYDAGLRLRASAFLTGEATALSYGAGHLWASIPADDSVARYDPRRKLIVTTASAQRPAGLAVAGGRVFVAGHTDHTVVVIDPKTSRPVGDPLPVPPNPWAVAAGAGHVWVSGIGANTLSRIDY